MRQVVALLLVVVLSMTLAVPANASVVWDGDASRGTGVFGHIGSNCAAPGSVTAVNDATHGRVWRYHKPNGSNRCESRGITVGDGDYQFVNGRTYYLGWYSKLSSTVNNNATFQWKSYSNHTQNFPFVLKVISGRISMLQRQPDSGERIIWSAPIAANTWRHFAIGVHLSSETRGGWLELWLDGQQQTFVDGSRRYACRTFDSENHPKWGVYGASGTTVTNFVDGLKVGTTHGDVDN
jgi:Polysaccharide lyase